MLKYNIDMGAFKLTAKQRRFAEEYLCDLNATAAYKRAGYAGKGHVAESSAAEILSNPEVAKYIQEAMDKRSAKIERTALDVLLDIESVMRDAMQPIADKDGNMLMANHAAALKALELEGRHRKMFTDKTEVSGANGGPVQVAAIDVSQLGSTELGTFIDLLQKVAGK